MGNSERRSWEWEPWEARRARSAPRASWEERERRQDMKLLFMVARARLQAGEAPVDLVPRLERLALDPALPARKRRVAASLMAQCRDLAG